MRKGQDELEQEAMRLLNAPLVEWEKAFDEMPEWERLEIEKLADGLCERAARLAAYASERYGHGYGDQTHRTAVRTQNGTARKVRKVLGYQLTSDVTF